MELKDIKAKTSTTQQYLIATEFVSIELDQQNVLICKKSKNQIC